MKSYVERSILNA